MGFGRGAPLVDRTEHPGIDGAHRRGRILWGLADCMAVKGYPATTISDIAPAARVSETVVHDDGAPGPEGR